MQPTAHSSKDYDADLLALRSRVLEAGGIVEYQIRYAIQALRTGDRTLVARVIADEERVNRLEREIDGRTHRAARAGGEHLRLLS
jgi:phosphate transport system protein